MKEKIKIIFPVFLLVAVLVTAIVFPIIVDARQGCCSHHGGVCGCRCCDGTSLSATCAPYYPQCNRPVQQNPSVDPTPTPTKTTPEAPKNDLQSVYDPETYTAQLSKNSDTTWLVLLGLGIGGFIIYLFLKRKK